MRSLGFAALAAITLSAGAASAIPATGMISITGYNSYSPTSVSFVGNGSTSAVGQTGSFSSVGTCFECVALNGFTFNPSLSPAPTTVFAATNNGVSVSFTLASISSFNVNDATSQLSINGIGTLALTGFDDTTGSFAFSTQGPSGAVVSFSATSVAVPEPMSLALLGAGLVGLGLVRRRA